MNATAHQIHHHLTRQAKHVAVIPHKNPDGDALGAAVAFYDYLIAHNIKATLWCKTGIPKSLNFLPHTAALHSNPALWLEHQFDTVCLFDASDPEFAGVKEQIESLKQPPVLINFDHHQSNTRFGDHNLIDIAAASTTEILQRYFHEINHALSPNLATALLTGLIYDTNNFFNPATSERALTAGANLLKAGAQHQTIINQLYLNKSPAALKLWGIALSRLCIKPELQLAYTALTQADIVATAATESDVEGIANFLSTLGETKISMILKEAPDGSVKGSLRTTHDDVDVAAMAAAFGGGGHKKAAGFSLPGRLVERNHEWLIIQSSGII